MFDYYVKYIINNIEKSTIVILDDFYSDFIEDFILDKLEDLEEWDSLSIMSTMAFLDKNFGVKTNMADYKNMTTIGDIARKAGL